MRFVDGFWRLVAAALRSMRRTAPAAKLADDRHSAKTPEPQWLPPHHIMNHDNSRSLCGIPAQTLRDTEPAHSTYVSGNAWSTLQMDQLATRVWRDGMASKATCQKCRAAYVRLTSPPPLPTEPAQSEEE